MTFIERLRGLTVEQLARLDRAMALISPTPASDPPGDAAAYEQVLRENPFPYVCPKRAAGAPLPTQTVGSSRPLAVRHPPAVPPHETSVHKAKAKAAKRTVRPAAKSGALPGLIMCDGGSSDPTWIGGEFDTFVGGR
jgi:hypothetical protein